MSIVNQMLNDLEKRRHEDLGSARRDVMRGLGAVSTASTVGPPLVWRWGLGVLLVGALTYAGLTYMPSGAKPVTVAAASHIKPQQEFPASLNHEQKPLLARSAMGGCQGGAARKRPHDTQTGRNSRHFIDNINYNHLKNQSFYCREFLKSQPVQARTTPLTIAKLTPPTSAQHLPTPTPTPTPNLLSKVSWHQRGDDRAELDLVLNQSTHYHLQSSSHQLTVWLHNTHYTQTHLPSLFAIGGAMLEKYQLRQRDRDIGIVLTLKPTSHLAGVHLNPSTSTPGPHHLRITLQSSAPASTQPRMTVHRQTKSTAMQRYRGLMSTLSTRTADDNIQQLKQLIGRYPTFRPAVHSLATLLLQQQQINTATQVVQSGLKRWPDDLALRMLNARVLAMQGQPERALQVLLAISPTLATHPDYYAFMAVLREQLGQPELAQQLYQQVLVIKPDQGKWWAGLGMAYEKTQQANSARMAFEHALASQQITPDLRALVGVKLSRLTG